MCYTIEEIRNKTVPIARKHGVLFHTDAVQAFGHIPIDVNARGEANDESDVDIFVDKGKMTSLIKYMAFVYDLESALDCHVDVVTTGIKDKMFLGHIQSEGVLLYEES